MRPALVIIHIAQLSGWRTLIDFKLGHMEYLIQSDNIIVIAWLFYLTGKY